MKRILRVNDDNESRAYLSETLEIDDLSDKTVTFKSGYGCTNSGATGNTTVSGNLTINNGTISIENFILQ